MLTFNSDLEHYRHHGVPAGPCHWCFKEIVSTF